MKIVPLSLQEANEFVKKYHRHNGTAVGHKFAIGAEKNGKLSGVAIASRPVSRVLDDGKTLEIKRVCVRPGQKNACSMLLARIRKLGLLMGYAKIITYTLKRESGSSLRAVGARRVAEVRPQDWKARNPNAKTQKAYGEWKYRWELHGGGGA